MAIFPQTNKIKYKHADYLYINHWKTTLNKSNAGHIRSFVRLPNVTSQLCTFSCHRQKNCRLLLCSKWSFLSHSVKMIYGPPCCSHQATTMQLLNRPKHACYGKPQQIFLPPSFWVVTWSAETRVFLRTTKGGREERPQERGWELRNMATKLSTDGRRETLWHIIIRGKSVLYFKSSGKVKNKWPVGGRLWILFESIWLKIKVIACVIIVTWNVWNS